MSGNLKFNEVKMYANTRDLKHLTKFPKQWVGDDGTTYPSGFLEALSTQDQEALGWYVIAVTKEAATELQHLVADPVVFAAGSMSMLYRAVDKFTEEQINELTVQEKHATRKIALDASLVTTASGNTFDADESAMLNLTSAIAASDPLDTTQWILADNSVITVTREELKEALKLAGQAKTVIWIS